MHCTLPRTESDILGISERQKASMPLKPLERHPFTTSEDCSKSLVVWRNVHNRCAFLTFLTHDWKILAVPVQCPDNTNHPTRHSQYTGRISNGSHVRSQSLQKPIENSNLLPDKKADRTVKTSANKKARKKGRKRKKPIGSDLQGNLNGGRDISESAFSSSDQNVPENFPVSGPENLLKSDDLRLSDMPSSNSSSELDIVLVSSDGDESLKIDSSVSDREVETRQKDAVNSNTGQRVLSDVFDLADHREETRRGNNQNAAKKSSRVKAVVNIPGASRSGTPGNSHSHNMGKENSHPVWQKVQRKVESENDSTKVNYKVVETKEAPRNEDKKQTPSKVSGKLKRKHYPSSKQESSRHSRTGSSADRTKLGSSNKSAHSDVASVSEVVSPKCTPGDRSRTGEAENMNPELLHGSRVCSDGLQLNGDSTNSTGNSDNEHMEDWDCSLGESPVDQNIMSSRLCLPHLLVHGVARSDKEDALTDTCRQKSISGSVTQKWVPVGTKTPAATGLTSKSCFPVEHRHVEPRQEQTTDVNSGSNVPEACQEQTLHVKSESIVPSLTSELVKDLPTVEEEEQSGPTENHDSCQPEEQNQRVVTESFIFCKLKVQRETDLDRIAKAVDNARRAQLESEAIQMATGGPIAEFERLLHQCSPVLSLSHSRSSCHMCSNHFSSSLCVHERPDISLGCLWQWYQKHGSFGLEICGKDYNNSKRLGIDRFSFRAYFVPYLSAVQLFRTSKRQMSTSSTRDPDVLATCENSGVGHLPIFPAESTEPSEPELFFEYFELEQPQQRRPLYDKIQELVRGDSPSDDKPYGDPSELNSINLHDLDPRSWYSVAWYPIYRIPDGNFRAAFLTYHSLGHLVRRNGVEDCVVSPVVGLQSYNAQGECWLKLTPSVKSQTSQIPSLDPSKTLTERLRTLEEAASLMSRAAVSKANNSSSVNKHPDFEFFLSRRRHY